MGGRRNKNNCSIFHQPELQADVHAVGAFVSCQLDEALLILEGDRHREVVDGTALHHAANVLCVNKTLKNMQ